VSQKACRSRRLRDQGCEARGSPSTSTPPSSTVIREEIAKFLDSPPSLASCLDVAGYAYERAPDQSTSQPHKTEAFRDVFAMGKQK